jgi:RNA polymerase sigma-70 factor, ECF subfamily
MNARPRLTVFAIESGNAKEPTGVRPDDEAEFAGLMERQWRFAFRVAWAVLRNAADAEDAAQEAFLKILRAEAWRGLRDERAFVARAVWRAAVDGLRSRAAQARSSGEGSAEDWTAMVEDARPTPETVTVTANWEAAVHRLIDSLPEELRQPLALSAEMTSREIAAAMGIAEGTVRTRLMRARQILREKMAVLEERRYAER